MDWPWQPPYSSCLDDEESYQFSLCTCAEWSEDCPLSHSWPPCPEVLIISLYFYVVWRSLAPGSVLLAATLFCLHLSPHLLDSLLGSHISMNRSPNGETLPVLTGPCSLTRRTSPFCCLLASYAFNPCALPFPSPLPSPHVTETGAPQNLYKR